MVIMPKNSTGRINKPRKRIPFSVVAPLLGGTLLGYVFITNSWKMSALVFGALIVSTITFFWTEYALFLFFFLLLMTTDAVYEGMFEQLDFFAIPEIDLPGLPSALNLVFLLMFAISMVKHYGFEKKSSVVRLRYLLVYTSILLMALGTGAAHPKATSDLLRLEFLKMLLPVLCFFLCINVFDDYNKIKKMIWVLFSVCVIKSIILDLYYLAGRGYPFGDYRIVSYDTAELMAFVIMIIYCIMMISYEKISGMRAWLTVLASSPLLFAVLFSFRRGHWIGMLLSLGLLYTWSPRRKKRRLMPYFSGLMVLLVPVTCFFLLTSASLSANDDTILSKLSSRFMTLFDPEQASNRHHIYETIQTMKDIMKSPFFGLGLASEHSPVDEDLGAWAEELQPLQVVHNTFVYMWMKTGLLGFLFLLWCSYKYAKKVMYYAVNYRQSENWPLTMSMGSGIGIWFIMFITGPVPFYLHQTYLIALFSALVLSLIRQDEQQHLKMKFSERTAERQKGS